VGCDAAGLQANTYNGRGVSALSRACSTPPDRF